MANRTDWVLRQHRIGTDLELEVLEDRHVRELFATVDANRAHLRQWLPWVNDSRSIDDTRAFVAGVRKQITEHNGFSLAIRHQQRLVGVIGIHHINWNNSFTSIGYWLAQDAQGQGIMTRACQALIDHLFDTVKLHRIEIRCAVDNRKSRAIPERLGFTNEGVARNSEWLNDRFVDLVVYARLATERNDHDE